MKQIKLLGKNYVTNGTIPLIFVLLLTLFNLNCFLSKSDIFSSYKSKTPGFYQNNPYYKPVEILPEFKNYSGNLRDAIKHAYNMSYEQLSSIRYVSTEWYQLISSI